MIYNDKNLEEVGARKCPKCGSTMNKQITSNGTIWTCNKCDYSDMDRIGKDFTAEYKTARRKATNKIEKLIDSPFEPISCSCRNHISVKKLKVRSTLSNGIEYICPKCGAVQIDINIKNSLDILFNLKDTFPDESAFDPVLQYLFIKIFSYNFQKWNDRIPGLIDGLSDTAADQHDLSDIEKYKKSLSKLQIMHAIDEGVFKLCPKCKSNYIHKDAKVCENCASKVKQNKEKKKKGAKVFFIFLLIMVLCAGAAFAVYKFRPEWIFGNATIEYYIDGEKFEVDSVYSKYIEIEPPQKTGYRFMGLYDAEIDGNQVIDSNGRSLNPSDYRSDIITLYPHWEAIIYRIILNAGNYTISNGSSVVTVETLYGELEKLIVPNESGEYKFLGWFLNDGTQVTDKDGNLLIEWIYTEEPISLNARTIGAKSVIMEYNLNDSSLKVSQDINSSFGIADDGRNYILDIPKANQYYKFMGWFLEDGTQLTDDCGASLSPWDNVNAIEKLNVYAHWENSEEYVGYTFISTVDEFTNIRSDLSGKYILMSDIDLGNITQWQPFGGCNLAESFTGVLDGQNHKIINLKRTDKVSISYDRGYFGLFGYVGSSGVVQNIAFDNVCINITSCTANKNVREFYSVVAGKCEGTLSNISVNGLFVFSCCDTGVAHLGGLCGVANDARISDCTNNIDITSDRYTSSIGGIAAYSKGGSFTNCKNNGNLTAVGTDWGGWAVTGAITGECYKGLTAFTNVINNGNLIARAYDNSSLFTNCTCKTGLETAHFTENIY